MPSSSLDPDTILDNDRQLGKDHGIDALGPSDLSDTGSDALGAYSDVDADVGTSDIGFERIATTDQPYDPALEISLDSLAILETDDEAELALDPTMNLDLRSITESNDNDEEEDGEEEDDENNH